MGTLEIKGITLDLDDQSGRAFVLTFKRELYPFERETVPALLSQKFSPIVVTGVNYVTIREANESFFTNPESRAKLKALVAEAEAQAATLLSEQHKAAAAKTAQAQETNLHLSEIDWDS
jgi:isocitrate/isopropylmalate dehydrogenase